MKRVVLINYAIHESHILTFSCFTMHLMDEQSIWLLMTIGPSTEKVKLKLFMNFPLKLYLLNAEESWNKTNKQQIFVKMKRGCWSFHVLPFVKISRIISGKVNDGLFWSKTLMRTSTVFLYWYTSCSFR